MLLIDFSIKAQVNIGIMTSITSMSVVFIAIFSNLFFGEKLKLAVVAGIAVIIAGVSIITISKNVNETPSSVSE